MIRTEDAPAAAVSARAIATVRIARCIDNLRTRLLYTSLSTVYKTAHAPNIRFACGTARAGVRSIPTVRIARCIDNLRTRLLYTSLSTVYKTAHAPNIRFACGTARAGVRSI